MPYRFYFHDRHGKIYHSVIVEVSSDAEALDEARRFDHVNAIEVWQGEKLIGTVKPKTGELPI